ncbi:prolipoprotein diacylglyceryl transferase [Myxococcota bacterium]|nr:prolipoprotein diacylglyceryl transferase [Myxococcota bacterium]
MLTPAAIQLLALSAGFWVALALYRRNEPDGQGRVRFGFGLVLGAVSAHLGWALLYADRIVATPAALLRPAGWSVLFVPFGVLVAAPWRGAPRERERFLRSAAASLPLALATTRIGCLAVGCCHGAATALPWGIRLGGDAIPRHPTALLDVAGLVLLHGLTASVHPQFRVPAALGGFGLLRLAIEPWRAAPPLAAPWLDARWIAALWVCVAGLLVLGGRRRLMRRERVEGSTGSVDVRLDAMDLVPAPVAAAVSSARSDRLPDERRS